MGFFDTIGNVLGFGGNGGPAGGQGVNYQPGLAPVLQLTNANQINQANQGVNNALAQQQAFVNAVNGANGIGNLSSVYGQLQGVANGTGPNPAQAMLAQATGANVANQAALMAGQRGAGANPALIARQAAQAGAGVQQNAAGQAATLQANQSLNALGQLGGIAGLQAGMQQGALSGLNQYALAGQGQQLNAGQGLNQTNLAQQQGVNTINAGLAGQTQKLQGQLIGGALSGLSGGLSSLAGGGGGAASGGPGAIGGGGAASTMFAGATGGKVSDTGIGSNPVIGPRSMLGKHLTMSQGGKVPALLSPGEKYLDPKQAKEVASGKKSISETGKTIPGKAKVKGDSLKNDTVKAKLDAGGVVVKRSVMNSPDVVDKAHAFVSAVMAQHGGMKRK